MSLLRRLLLALPLLAALAVAGCKINSINYFPPHPAQVRVMNLMPDAPSLDLQINGSPAFAGVAFESYTGYQSYDNQQTTFTVFLTGSASPLVTFSYPLAGEQPYTVLLYGSVNNPQITMVAEVASAPTNGSIQFAVFNAAVNNGSVDIYVTTPGVDIGTVNPNFGNVGFGGTTFNLAFQPGTYQIQVTPQGTKTVIYDSGGSALTPNIALSFITYSRGSGTLVNAAVLQAQGPIAILNSIFARMKAVNAAPVVGPVNQLIAALAVNANVNFATGSPYTTIPQGPTTVNFEASATPGATVATTPATIAAAVDTSAVVAGNPGSQVAFVLSDLNVPPSAGNDRLRFVNASQGSNPVNAAVQGNALASNVAFGTASPYVQVASGTVTVVFTDAASGAVLAQQDGVVLTPNQTTSFYLIGPPGAQSILVTQDN
ncbi:MAG: DUF4397 domain-containing protein [Burkholderiales bacterium]|nr:DUF4397 domain-containing protein [Burkholderiales bacterium]